jgi:membrane protease YdiL (CAAX protease family)
VSSDPNIIPPQPEMPTEIISPSGATQILATPPPAPEGGESPVWSGWDVLALVGVTLFGFVFVGFFAGIVILFLPAYRGRPIEDIRFDPILNVSIMIGVYALLIAAMVMIIRVRYRRPFLEALSWHWPRRVWAFPVIGVAMGFAIAILTAILPMPKSAPIDRMLHDAPRLMSLVAIFIAPPVEELFFRGFLYPVLTRWRAIFSVAIAALVFGIGALLFSLLRQNHDAFGWGLGIILAGGAIASLWLFSAASRRVATLVSVLVTSFLFALIHSQQLAHAWTAVLLIFLVGLVLTTIRARTRSLAASVLAHMAYNATLCTMFYFATDHFRHMQRMQ